MDYSMVLKKFCTWDSRYTGTDQRHCLWQRQYIRKIKQMIKSKQYIWNGELFNIKCCTWDKEGYVDYQEFIVQYRSYKTWLLVQRKKCCASFFVNHPLHIFDSLTFKKKVVKGFLCHFHSRSTEKNLWV